MLLKYIRLLVFLKGHVACIVKVGPITCICVSNVWCIAKVGQSASIYESRSCGLYCESR